MKQFTATAVAWKMAIVHFMFFSLTSLGSAVLVSMEGTKWNGLDTQTKVLICIGIFVNWGQTIMAFMSKSAQKIDKGLTPTDTSFWQADPGFDPKKTTPPI